MVRLQVAHQRVLSCPRLALRRGVPGSRLVLIGSGFLSLWLNAPGRLWGGSLAGSRSWSLAGSDMLYLPLGFGAPVGSPERFRPLPEPLLEKVG